VELKRSQVGVYPTDIFVEEELRRADRIARGPEIVDFIMVTDSSKARRGFVKSPVQIDVLV
jgi:hypothetical protein